LSTVLTSQLVSIAVVIAVLGSAGKAGVAVVVTYVVETELGVQLGVGAQDNYIHLVKFM